MRSIILAVLLSLAAPAIAQSENGLTLYAGYRFGGEFTDVNTEQPWEFTDGGSFALSLAKGIDPQRQYEFFVSHRNGALKPPGLSAVTSNVSLAVTYYHIGGNYFPDGLGQGVYLAGGLGLTHLDPREAGLNSETRFSLSLAFGYMIPARKNFGFKLEARGYATLVDSTTAIFCSGGCIIQVKGDSFTQVDVLAGVSARF
jgi:hypothetical protein